MNYFDAHCHLQDARLLPSLKSVLDRSSAANVVRMVCCGTREQDWDAVMQVYAANAAYVIPAFGVHPWYVDSLSETWEHSLATCLSSVPSTIGECGLDFANKYYDEPLQVEVFKKQLSLARDLHVPISIHCRKAWGRLVSILKEFGSLPAGGLIHSCSGAAELIPFFEQVGLYVSFSGSAANPRSVKVHEALKSVTDNRLLIETDSPDLFPCTIFSPEDHPVNEPANITAVAAAVARLRGVTQDRIAAQTYENGERLFASVIA